MTETHRFGRRLRRGRWTVRDAGDLKQVIARAAESETEWQGIAYTTAGARALRSISEGALLGTDGEQVQHNTVYELRLWSVIEEGGEADDVLAHELRWLNGSGAAEIVVGASREGLLGGSDCWVRDNSYLQHGEKGDVMDSIEVFTVEETYGNTVFADELMTGRWG